MSELHGLREAWERAEARLHAHLPAEHRGHLSQEHLMRVADLQPEIADDILADPGEVEQAVAEARTTYDAYLQGVRTLGAGMG
jgi:hypothetical protein